jgi:hypothetical protein
VPEPQLKGSAYLSTLAFIDGQSGAATRERVLARLQSDDRALLSGMLLPIAWYPLAPFPRLLRAMEAELGRGDFALITERGRWAAVHDMTTVHKLLLKLVNTQWLVEKGMRLWPNFHSTGRWEASPDGDHGARAVLTDLGVVDEAICATLKGWLLGLLGLTGAKNATTQHTTCRARGDTSCTWQMSWR